jgi:hypothetical protein
MLEYAVEGSHAANKITDPSIGPRWIEANHKALAMLARASLSE